MEEIKNFENNNEQVKVELDTLYFGKRNTSSIEDNLEEAHEVYVSTHDNKKRVQVSKKDMKSKKKSKTSFRGLMAGAAVVLCIGGAIGNRLVIGSANVSQAMNNSKKVEWFRDYYYVDGTGRLIEKSSQQIASDYEKVMDGVVQGMLDEGWNIDQIAVKLDHDFGIHDNSSALLKESSFLGKMKVKWDGAFVSNLLEEEETAVKGVSR